MRFLNSHFSMVLLHKTFTYTGIVLWYILYIKGTNKYIDFPLKFQIFALCILISLWGDSWPINSLSVCTFFRGLYLFNVQKRRVQYLLGDAMYDDDLSCCGASKRMGYVYYGDRSSRMKIGVLKCVDMLRNEIVHVS